MESSDDTVQLPYGIRVFQPDSNVKSESSHHTNALLYILAVTHVIALEWGFIF